MSTNQKVYVGDTGTSIVLNCVEDISAATAWEIEARRPDGSEVTWTGSASGTTAVQFITQADTLTQAGVWRLQAKVTTPAGVWRGNTATLKVYERFA